MCQRPAGVDVGDATISRSRRRVGEARPMCRSRQRWRQAGHSLGSILAGPWWSRRQTRQSLDAECGSRRYVPHRGARRSRSLLFFLASADRDDRPNSDAEPMPLASSDRPISEWRVGPWGEGILPSLAPSGATRTQPTPTARPACLSQPDLGASGTRTTVLVKSRYRAWHGLQCGTPPRPRDCR